MTRPPPSTPTPEEHFRLDAALSVAIIENAEDAIIAKSLDGTVLTWNAGATRIFGYTAAEMIGGPITRLFPSERLHEAAELIAQLTHGKKISHFVTQRLRKNGSTIDVSVALSPVRDPSGRIVAVSKIARDITEAYQRQLASALATAIVEHSDDAIISRKPIASLPVASVEEANGPVLFASASSQIDSTVARGVFGDNTALLVSLLARLVHDFSEFALPVSVQNYDAAALSHLMGRLHKLGGGAGMIGATTVHRLAGAAEAALAAGQAPQMIEAVLRQLAAAFTALGEELAPMLAATAATNAPLNGQFADPIAATSQSIERLLELLDDHNMEAITQLSAMSASLSTRLGEPRFARLQEAVSGLEFAMAAAMLRECSGNDGQPTTDPRDRLHG